MRRVSCAYRDEDFQIDFEDFQSLRFIHVSMSRLSPNIVRKFKTVFKQLKVQCKQEGYSELRAYTQNKKFAQLMDDSFEKETSVIYEGKEYEVLRWVLK